MAMIKCPECGREMSSWAQACPCCGVPQDIIKKLLAEQRSMNRGNATGLRRRNLNVGQHYSFGSFIGEKIWWRVLAIEDDKALLISDKCLATKPYNETDADVTWETCTLRKWLNTEFLINAFSSEEEEQIIITQVTAEPNEYYDTNPGSDTWDKIFLPSSTEVKKYLTVPSLENDFDSTGGITATATDYALAYGATLDSIHKTSHWWLRTPGRLNNTVIAIDTIGLLGTYGTPVNSAEYCVRPAIWIDLTYGDGGYHYA